MQWYKNKIFTSSAVYLLSLVAIAIISGMWHNARMVSGASSPGLFILFIILLVFFLSWFYFLIFNTDRKIKEQAEEKDKQVNVEIEGTTKKDVAEEVVKERFDKEAFLSDVLKNEQKNIPDYCEMVLRNLADRLQVVSGLFYMRSEDGQQFESVARYAFYSEVTPPVFRTGESLPGQAIQDRKVLVISNIPESYIPVVSGLGSGKPRNLVFLPVVADHDPIGLIEIAVFKMIDPEMEGVLKDLGLSLGAKLIKMSK